MSSGFWDGSMAALIGAISGGVVSWAVTHHAGKSQRRWVAYERIESLVDRIQIDALSYWRSEGLNGQVEILLIQQLEHLDLSIQGFNRLPGKEIRNSEALIDALTECVTGGNFQTASRRRDMARLQGIRRAVKDIKDEACRLL